MRRKVVYEVVWRRNEDKEDLVCKGTMPALFSRLRSALRLNEKIVIRRVTEIVE